MIGIVRITCGKDKAYRGTLLAHEPRWNVPGGDWVGQVNRLAEWEGRLAGGAGPLLPNPSSGFSLFGPRGTGKTTWLRQELPSAVFVNLLEPDTLRQLGARPERLVELIRGGPEGVPAVLDELQRVPGLLTVVHNIPDRELRG